MCSEDAAYRDRCMFMFYKITTRYTSKISLLLTSDVLSFASLIMVLALIAFLFLALFVVDVAI